jgi:hypothetical protein
MCVDGPTLTQPGPDLTHTRNFGYSHNRIRSLWWLLKSKEASILAEAGHLLAGTYGSSSGDRLACVGTSPTSER